MLSPNTSCQTVSCVQSAAQSVPIEKVLETTVIVITKNEIKILTVNLLDYLLGEIDSKVSRVVRENQQSSYKCLECQYEHVARHVVISHVESRHVSMIFHCQHCDHQFRSRNALRVHIYRKHKM